ncbi:MAG: hypothetical protein AABW93_00160 [Nanoarchaeota archaeon]
MENELILKVPTFYRITRSFDRKVQVKQFEPISFFSTHGMDIPLEEATPEKIAEVSKTLSDLSMREVESDIERYVNRISVENGDMIVPPASELIGIVDLIKKIAESNKETIETIIKEVSDNKNKYSEIQLMMLRRLALQARNG